MLTFFRAACYEHSDGRTNSCSHWRLFLESGQNQGQWLTRRAQSGQVAVTDTHIVAQQLEEIVRTRGLLSGGNPDQQQLTR